MKRLRIVLSTERRDYARRLEQVLTAAHHQIVAAIESVDDLVVYAQQAQAEALVVERSASTPLLLQQLRRLHEVWPMPAVVFVDRSGPLDIQAAVKAGVTAYVVDGFRVERVAAVFEAAVTRFQEFQALRVERDEAVARLTERKHIERAKGILMRRRRLDEEAAYHTLRKMAMDRGLRLAEVARSVVVAEEALAG